MPVVVIVPVYVVTPISILQSHNQARNRSSAARSISMPRPGPLGTRTHPPSCSIGSRHDRLRGSGARCGRIRAAARAAQSAGRVVRQHGEQLQRRGEGDAGAPDMRACSGRRRPRPCRRSSCTPRGRRPRRCRAGRCRRRARASRSRKPKRVNSHSPPATGIDSAGLHLAVAAEVLGRHRLLEPADVEVLDRAAEADRRRRVVGVVGIDHQRRHPGRSPRAPRASRRRPRSTPKPILSFIAAKPAADIAGRLLAQIVARIAALARGRGRWRRRAPRCAAAPPISDVHRLRRSALPLMSQSAMSMPLSAWIASPSGRDRAGGRRASARCRSVRERVLADQQRRVGLDDAAVRPRRAVALAPAGQPLVGDDLDDAAPCACRTSPANRRRASSDRP